MTNNVRFFTHDGSIWVLRNLGLVDKDAVLYGRIAIGNNCNIGWDTMIMPGVTIGNNVIVGAGSIVTKDIPNDSIAAGVPAKIIGNIYDYASRKGERCAPTLCMNESEKRAYLEKNYPELFEAGLSE